MSATGSQGQTQRQMQTHPGTHVPDLAATIAAATDGETAMLPGGTPTVQPGDTTGTPVAATGGPLRLGTRGSQMARTQSGIVADVVTQRSGRPVEMVLITTHGDVSKAALTQIGGTGVFVGALRESLIAREVDFAVHSLKDLPTGDHPSLMLAAVPGRDDPRDALVGKGGKTLAQLAGGRIGTGSPRRAAQLRAMGLDLEVVPIRGNADSRVKMATEGDLDGVVLAYAGLRRIGRDDLVSEVFDIETMLPAPGQGALAVECRLPAGAVSADEVAYDQAVLASLALLDDSDSRAVVTAERVFLNVLEAGCVAPVGAYAQIAAPSGSGPQLSLQALVLAEDGSRSVRMSTTGPLDDAAGIGRALAERMLAEGAGDLMEAVT